MHSGLVSFVKNILSSNHSDNSNKSSKMETKLLFDLSEANPDVIRVLLLRLFDEDLLTCRSVCRQWKTIIDRRSFWIEREELHGQHYLRDLAALNKPFLGDPFFLLALRRPYEHNHLIEDASNKYSDKRWRFIDGGSGWRVAEPPVFFNGRFVEGFEHKFERCLETSYQACKKQLRVSLTSLGISPQTLKSHKPPIVFSEWVANRADCGSQYMAVMSLLDDEGAEVASNKTEVVFEQWQDQDWVKVELKLEDYPESARLLMILVVGSDTQFWAGHYGVKTAGSDLRILMEHGSAMNERIEFTDEN